MITQSELASASVTPAGAEATAFIQIRGLNKSFGDTVVLPGLDLDVPEGQFLVLLGPSGCGKTTTMRCLVGLETAESGTISVDGRTVFDSERSINVPANKRDMGMVFQSYALWPHKNVHGNVGFPLKMQRKPKREIQQRVDETLELVGLGGYGKRSINTLSGGQMQRVALARSLVMHPTILLLDEPLSNLDAKLRVHLRHELREIQERIGVTTIYVTHDQDEALGLADRIVVMCEGRVAQDGPPERLYTAPASPFVADFLGVSNQFAVEIRKQGTATIAILDEGLELEATDNRAEDHAPAVACIRPEHLVVRHETRETTSDARNHIAGEILSLQYQGNRIRYHVRLDGGPDLFCEGPVTVSRLVTGDRCAVLVKSDHVTILSGMPFGQSS